MKTKNMRLTDFPDLISEWDFEKNNTIKPELISHGSHVEAWWKCRDCGHQWKASVKNRVKGTGCPVCAGRKTIAGTNDFGTKHPELLDEWDYVKNIGINPEEFPVLSSKKVWWKCHACGFEWETSIGHRTQGSSCPVCSNKTVWSGHNDLNTIYPDLSKEWDYTKNDFSPCFIVPGSNKNVWWKCPNNHPSYLSSPYKRIHGAGCPICNTIFQTSLPEQIVYFYIKKYFPDAINRYKGAFIGNMELDIYIPSLKTAIEYDGYAWHRGDNSLTRERKKYKLCRSNSIYLIRIREELSNDGNEDKVFNISRFKYENTEQLKITIEQILQNLTHENGIDIDIKKDLYQILQYKIIKFEDSLAYLFPDVAKEWDYELNNGLNPENVLPGTSLKVWWRCKNGHIWKGSVVNRTKGHGCDICAREQRKETYHNVRLQTRYLLVGCKCVQDWDYLKNEHTPDYYTKGSGEKVWWKCHKCGHEWKTAICDRTRDYKNGCPACSKRILVKGVNDLETTNPELLSEWSYELNKNPPSEVTQWSHTKVWWKCQKCGYSYEATPSNRVYGKGCGCCAGRVVVQGINDLSTTRPDIAIDWNYEKNNDLKPTEVTRGRRTMVWWKCHICGNEWQDTLNHRNRGRGCSKCKKARRNK